MFPNTGGGNMAGSMIGGMIAKGFSASNIFVSEPVSELGSKLKDKYGVNVTNDNNAALHFTTSSSSSHADVVVLAVKPQVLKVVSEGISESVQKLKPLVISIAAGIRVDDLARWLSASPSTHEPLPGAVRPSIVRVMPNTPALVLEGASGLWAGSEREGFLVEKESLLDVVTGVSGSGPAYFFYLLEAMENAGVAQGLPRDVARGLAAQTCLGAGKMAVSQLEDPSILRKNVTSPNGTTAAAIKTFDDAGMLKLCLMVSFLPQRGERSWLTFSERSREPHRIQRCRYVKSIDRL
ncbi:pyrroline-5-carboxylate reductase dimerization-domain-containing protein [Chytridium lagenaria]|nr:pyrroline-5-carboxylate reductase dimerization-domain-containing protein [Chytridium lagenaria]